MDRETVEHQGTHWAKNAVGTPHWWNGSEWVPWRKVEGHPDPPPGFIGTVRIDDGSATTAVNPSSSGPNDTTTKVVAILFWLAAGAFSAINYRLQDSADLSFLMGRALGSLVLGFILGYVSWRFINRRTPDRYRSQFSTVYFIAAGVIVAITLLPS